MMVSLEHKKAKNIIIPPKHKEEYIFIKGIGEIRGPLFHGPGSEGRGWHCLAKGKKNKMNTKIIWFYS